MSYQAGSSQNQYQTETTQDSANQVQFKIQPDYGNFFEIKQDNMQFDYQAPLFICKNCQAGSAVPIGTYPGQEIPCQKCSLWGPYEPQQPFQREAQIQPQDNYIDIPFHNGSSQVVPSQNIDSTYKTQEQILQDEIKQFQQIKEQKIIEKNKVKKADVERDPWGRPKFKNGICQLCGFDEDGRRGHKLNHKARHPILNFNSLCDVWTSVLECPFILSPIWSAIQIVWCIFYYWVVVPLVMLFYPVRHASCGADGCHSCGEGIEFLMLICPCVMMALFFPFMVYGFVFGIPTIAIWFYCFPLYHGICFYFIFRVLKREIIYFYRKHVRNNLTDEELQHEQDQKKYQGQMDNY